MTRSPTQVNAVPHPGEGGRRYPTVRVTSVALALRWASRRSPYSGGELAGLRPLVRPGAVCLDIGAEYGRYTWVLSALAGPTGRVCSVEPRPGRAGWLSVLVGVLGCGNVTVYRTALAKWPRPGTVSPAGHRPPPVHGPARAAEGAARPGPRSVAALAAPVPPQTLDGMCHRLGLERVDFIRAAVVGAETAVLTGAFITLLRDRPVLLLEFRDRRRTGRGADLADTVRGLTASLGYGMYRRHGGRWRPVTQVTDDCRTYLFSAGPTAACSTARMRS